MIANFTRSALASLVAGAATLLTVAGSVTPAHADTPRVVIGTAGIDIVSPAGQALLAARVRQAADAICGTDARDLKSMRDADTCRRATITDGEAQLATMTARAHADRLATPRHPAEVSEGSAGGGSPRRHRLIQDKMMSVISLKTPPAVAAVPGTGMDRALAPARPNWRRRLMIGAVALLLLGGGIAVWIDSNANSQTVAASHLTISTVTRGRFDDFVPLRARVTPLVTVYLDSVEGGRIDRVLVEDGAQVTPGQPLAVLSNATLQLDVIAREADVSQQLNNLRTQELELQRSRLENRRNLAEIDWQVRKSTRQLDRDSTLAAGGWVSGKALKDSQDETAYLRQRQAVTNETLQTEERLQASQLEQLRSAATQLTANLRLARASLDALTIRAPVGGSLSGFNPQVGQSLNRGERLGQIDSAGRNKLVADIDEFYLGRVERGQRATVEWEGKAYPLTIAKIYPQVKGGSFIADLTFDGPEPAELQRGQTLPPRLTLGDPAMAVLLPNGAFYTDSGGSFVFALSADGHRAEKRAVRLGRRNPDFIEVIGGLNPGDRVITSAYTGFADKDRLKLSGD